MPYKFKAPVEFFQAVQLPPRCLITGREDKVVYHNLQLPFLRGMFAIPAILIQPLPMPPNGNAELPVALHDRGSSAWRDTRGLLIWVLLLAWLGYLFGGFRGMLYLNLVLLSCTFLYRVFFKTWRQRRVAAGALHFSLPLAATTPSEARRQFGRQALRWSIGVPYYVSMVLFVTRIDSPLHDWYTGMFWGTWLLFVFVNRWISNAYPLIQLGPKRTWLQIRFPDKNKPLFEEYCVQFMRWKQSENFPTDIDYDINDWPDEGDGAWDSHPPTQ